MSTSTVSSEWSADGTELTIRIRGRFDHAVHGAFREAFTHPAEPPERYCVDLGETEYLDSSALGMLLLLRDHGGGDQASIRLANPNANVRKILNVSNFNQLFDIDQAADPV